MYNLNLQIWLSCNTPGSGRGGLGFESASYQRRTKMELIAPQPVLVIMSLSEGNAFTIEKVQLIPCTVDIQIKVVQFKELVV